MCFTLATKYRSLLYGYGVIASLGYRAYSLPGVLESDPSTHAHFGKAVCHLDISHKVGVSFDVNKDSASRPGSSSIPTVPGECRAFFERQTSLRVMRCDEVHD